MPSRRFPPPLVVTCEGFVLINQRVAIYLLQKSGLSLLGDGPMLALTFRVPVCPPGETHSPRASGTPQRTLDIRQRFSLQAMMSRKNDWRNPNKI